jgi:putative transposase
MLSNWRDSVYLEDVLSSVVVERPASEQHLLLDKGYDTPRVQEVVEAFVDYTPHIRPIRQERRKARRWVERTLAWLRKCRSILVRYCKHAASHLGLIQLVCALLWYRRQRRLTKK